MSENDIRACLNRVKKILSEETSLLSLKAPIKVVGDMYVSVFRSLNLNLVTVSTPIY